MKFFEEYKRLDKFCCDAFSCSNGVSQYIAEMERVANQGARKVPSWETDYKQIKHLRWVRNQIAHDTTSAFICENGDLELLEDLYDRFLSQNDPLSLLNQALRPQKKPQPPKQTQSPVQYQPREFESNASSGIVAVLIALLIVIGICIYIFSKI